MKNNEKIYQVNRVFKNDKNRIVDENLTREEAQKMVEEDIKENPNCEYYMLTFDKMAEFRN
tara:strand:- start:1 stop:183 length:183 start_codon:yes stop_codon:yes gene_type:complete